MKALAMLIYQIAENIPTSRDAKPANGTKH
jgi:hypothetical protein